MSIPKPRKSLVKVGIGCLLAVRTGLLGAKGTTTSSKQSTLSVSTTATEYNLYQFALIRFVYEVLHGVKAAILNALKENNADSLEGATLYSTLIPDHNDSQMIREVGISRVVYRDDKYPQYAFTVASKKLLDGLDWR